jgi:hypothetical protein
LKNSSRIDQFPIQSSIDFEDFPIGMPIFFCGISWDFPAKKWLSKQTNLWEILQRVLQDSVEALKTPSRLRDFGLTTGLQKPVAFLRGSGRVPVTKDGDLKPSKSGFKGQRCGFQHDLYNIYII